MINHIVLIGRLTHNPKLQYTSSGLAVCTFTLAVDRPFKNQSGEKETDFIDVVVWRKLAENCAEYLGKGNLTAVEGRLQVRNYEAKDGSKRKAFEVVAENVQFLSPKPKEKPADAPVYDPQEAQGTQVDGPFGPGEFVSEDDLPF